MELPQNLPEAIISKARSLQSLGLHEVAWTKNDALDLLSHLANRQVAVLGGDVYEEVSGLLTAIDENWFCERQAGEGFPEYAERSRQAALAFVHGFPDLSGVLFSLVMREAPTAGLRPTALTRAPSGRSLRPLRRLALRLLRI